ncbi:MAG: hypothetical protein Q6358_13795, partial [Candidatus Brocadiales bacterium]|nr:hypothetical protein [Candidatus Brocadiales bacterium]
IIAKRKVSEMKIIFVRLVAFIACIVATIVGSIFLGTVLDYAGYERLHHLVGTIGASLILISVVYSLRRRKILLKSGNLKHWLTAHEWLAIVGTGLVFIHGGFYGHAVVPLITTGVMFVTVVSGLTGRYLYLHVSKELMSRKKEMEEKGLTKNETEDTLSSLVVTHGVMKHWRTVHIPIVFALAMIVTYHVLSALYYEGFGK